MNGYDPDYDGDYYAEKMQEERERAESEEARADELERLLTECAHALKAASLGAYQEFVTSEPSMLDYVYMEVRHGHIDNGEGERVQAGRRQGDRLHPPVRREEDSAHDLGRRAPRERAGARAQRAGEAMSFDEPFPKGNRPDEQDWKSDEDVYDELRRLFHAGKKGDAVGRAGIAGDGADRAAGGEGEALHGGGAVKPMSCPFCGGEASVCLGVKMGDEDEYLVQCDDCYALSDQFYSEDAAIGAWNKRTATTDEQFARAVHDGKLWVCVERALGSDELKPIPGFTRDGVYRDSMREYGEWMEKATALMRDMRDALIGYECWLCSEMPDKMEWARFDERLREFGIGGE